MDAHAHLLSLGWAGPGHSLDSRPSAPGTYKQKGHRGLAYDPSKDPLKVGNTGNGLVKPLLLSQRKNRFGVGKKAHEAPAGNEWWLKGFESALGNIGKSESERSSSVSTPTNDLATRKHGSLYTFFTQGQVMQGTIGPEHTKRTSRKRKSEELEQGSGGELNPRPATSRAPTTTKDFELVGAFMRERDRERKRREKKEEASEMEQFTQIQQFFGAAEKERKGKKRKSEKLSSESGEVAASNMSENLLPETKEERRERRRRRREEKAAEIAVDGEEQDAHRGSEDVAEKAARRAERKRWKAEKEARKQ